MESVGRTAALRARRLMRLLRHGGLDTAADDADQRLRLEQSALELLTGGAASLGVVWLVAAPLAGWLLQGFIGAAWAWGGAALMGLWAGECLLFLQRLRAAPWRQGVPTSSAAHDPRRWARGLGGRLLVAGGLFHVWSWGAAASPEGSALALTLALGSMLAAAATSLLGAWPAAVWACVTPLLLGMGVAVWTVEAWQAGARGAACLLLLVLWAALLVAAQRGAGALQRARRERLRDAVRLAELEARCQQAETASVAKSRALAVASHDLRQPVHALSLLGSRLHDKLADTQHAAAVGQLLAGVALLSQQVDELADQVRLDDAEATPRMGAVSVQALLARAELAYRPLVRARGLALWLRQPRGAAPQVLADSELLWRVLGNLLANAVQHTSQGGVMLAVRRAHLSRGRAAWRLEVRASEAGPAIVPPGSPAGGPRSEPADGAAATYARRLAMAQRLARRLHARVRVHAGAGNGMAAVCSITLEAVNLRACAPASARPPAQTAVLPRLARACRVLLVDDDALAREALALTLTDWGVWVDAASGVADAAALAEGAARQGQPVDALITDHWLGKGVLSADVIAAVRPHAPGLRVAVLSGDALLADEQAMRAQGMALWRKPLQPELLHTWLSGAPVPGG